MKRFITAILPALLLAAILALPAQAVETPYVDIDPDAWYAWCVNDTARRGLMNGTGGRSFTPNGDLTRAMLVTVLWRLAGEPEAGSPVAFTDVPEGTWYTDALAWAASEQVVEGYGGGAFGPDDPVTREQMAVIFCRWGQGQGYDVSFTPNDHLAQEESGLGRYQWFEEEGLNRWVSLGRPISEWALDAVQWAAERDFLVRREVRGQDLYGGSIYCYCVYIFTFVIFQPSFCNGVIRHIPFI